jgi:hypothetical protein
MIPAIHWPRSEIDDGGRLLLTGVVEDQRLLGREVTEEGPLGHAGPVGDLVDGGGGEALLGEERERRLEDHRPRLLHLPFAQSPHEPRS